MNEERLEREKNKRIKLNGSSDISSTSNNSQPTSSQISYPTSSNGNTSKTKVSNGNNSEKQEDNQKEVAKIHPKISKSLSTSGKRIQKELAELTLDPPPNCR